jgi:hypothetical protein
MNDGTHSHGDPSLECTMADRCPYPTERFIPADTQPVPEGEPAPRLDDDDPFSPTWRMGRVFDLLNR